MATPPSFVSFAASVFNTTTSPKTVSVTTQTGDQIVVMSVAAGANNGAVNTAPTGNSNTFTQRATLGTTLNHARAVAWTATEVSGATYNISAVRPSTDTSVVWGVMVWVWRNSDGIGAIGAPTVNSTSNLVTFTLTGNNSGLAVASADWNAIDGATRTRRTINGSTGAEDSYYRDTTTYAAYGQHYLDCGAAGSVTAGYSAPTGQVSAIIAVEIFGTASGPTPPPDLIMQTRRAY